MGAPQITFLFCGVPQVYTGWWTLGQSFEVCLLQSRAKGHKQFRNYYKMLIDSSTTRVTAIVLKTTKTLNHFSYKLSKNAKNKRLFEKHVLRISALIGW